VTINMGQVDQEQINARVDEAGAAIDELRDIADELNLGTLGQQLDEAHDNLRASSLKVLAYGEFKVGKSTLLNGMLGQLDHEIPGLGTGAPLPTDELPATAVLTSIVYGEEPRVRAWLHNGTAESWDWEQFIRRAIVDANKERNAAKFGHIREFEVNYPSELCKKRVTLIDAPGLNDDLIRDEITLAAVGRADAALLIYRSDKFGGMTTRDYEQQMLKTGLDQTFRIVNLFHGRRVDERLCSFVWEQLVAGDSGAEYAGQLAEELRGYRIYFVDAGKAEEGVKTRNAELVRESGLTVLMDDLFAFLTRERLPIMVQRHAGRAIQVGENIDDSITKTMSGLQQSKAGLLLRIERAEPRRQELLRKQAELPTIIERYRLIAQRNAVASYQQFNAALIAELPAFVDQAQLVEPREGALGIVGTMIDRLRAGLMAERASGIVTRHVTERRIAWQKETWGLPSALQGDGRSGPVPNMMAEIDEKIADIEADIAGIETAVVGNVDDASRPAIQGPGKIRKGIGFVLAGLTLDPGFAASGMAGDLKGMAIGYGLLSLATLTIGNGAWLGLAGPVGWAAIAGIAAFNIIRAQGTIHQRVREGTLRSFIEGTPKGSFKDDPEKEVVGLRDMAVREQPLIEAAVKAYFDELETIITSEVDSAIKSQRDEFQALIDKATDDLAKRDEELIRLNGLHTRLTSANDRLKKIQYEAGQR
jgi:hypothetical protein